MSLVSVLKNLFKKSSEGGVRSATITIAFFMFASQVIGLVRDRLLAGSIGTGPILDSYYAAFKIPDLIYTVGGALVSVAILLPFITERLEGEGKDKQEARNLLGMVAKLYLCVFGVLIILFELFMPQIISLVYPGLGESSFELTVQLTRIMMLSPLFFIAGELFATVTQYTKRFVIYAFSPVFYNAGIVVGILFFYPKFGPAGLALGVVLGAFTKILLQLPVSLKEDLFPNLFTKIDWKLVKKIISVSWPRTIGLVVVAISGTILLSFASKFGDAAISRLSFALLISNVPLALASTSYATAMFPNLVSAITGGRSEEAKKLLVRAVGDVSLIIFSITAIGLVLRTYGVRLLLGTGNFSWTDTRLVSAALCMLLLTLPLQALDTLALRLYYALGETFRPMMRNVYSTVATVVATFLLVILFNKNPASFDPLFNLLSISRQTSGISVGIVVVSLGYVISSVIALFLIWIPLLREYLSDSISALFSVLVKNVFIAFITGATSWIALHLVTLYISGTDFISIAIIGIPSGVVGVLCGFLMFKLVNKNS